MIYLKLKLYLLKEIPQIIYSLYQAKETTEKVYAVTMTSIKV